MGGWTDGKEVRGGEEGGLWKESGGKGWRGFFLVTEDETDLGTVLGVRWDLMVASQ